MNHTEHHVFTISELNNTARELLEANFETIWVEGEISTLHGTLLGHWYFTLKDKKPRFAARCFFSIIEK